MKDSQPGYGLPTIEDAEPLCRDDAQLVDELRAVLKRHGALGRFGLTLLHQHFPLNDDEVLLETNDPESRTLMLRPVRLRDVPSDRRTLQTSWRLDVDEPLGNAGPRCVTSCYVDLKDRHTRKHERLPLQPNR